MRLPGNWCLMDYLLQLNTRAVSRWQLEHLTVHYINYYYCYYYYHYHYNPLQDKGGTWGHLVSYLVTYFNQGQVFSREIFLIHRVSIQRFPTNYCMKTSEFSIHSWTFISNVNWPFNVSARNFKWNFKKKRKKSIYLYVYIYIYRLIFNYLHWTSSSTDVDWLLVWWIP